MKNLIVAPSKIILAIGLATTGALYFASTKYTTVSCLAGGDCFIPGTTPLWIVATWALAITIILAGLIAFCDRKLKP